MRYSGLISLLPLYVRARASARYATKHGLIGMEFNHFGHQLGWCLLRKGSRSGISYLLNPVSSVRYFEFSFALSCLADIPEKCLDVSSPRLFSFYMAKKCNSSSILIINPDICDLDHTKSIIQKLEINSIQLDHCGVEILVAQREIYDCIWSISVIEHIEGGCSDTQAVQLMYNALKRGGKLVLTVPVDRYFWDEYRNVDHYGTQLQPANGEQYFFQHFYDKVTLWERIVSPIGQEPSAIRWFGETSPGSFAEYVQRWRSQGYKATTRDPQYIVDHYQEFDSWEAMPGMGVCGLMFEKPR